MPYAALRPCTYPGCTELVRGGRCSKHCLFVERDPERQRLYGRRWRRMRQAYLAEHPWCEECLSEGRYVAATDVHHKERHEGDASKFYGSDLQALCHACHSRKTAEEVGFSPPIEKSFQRGRPAHGISNARKIPRSDS
jgi:5-methylcytosine-specific restriction protein A